MINPLGRAGRQAGFLLAALALLAACQSNETRVVPSNYAIEVTEQPGAIIVTFLNKTGRDLCMPYSSWPGTTGHRGFVEDVPAIVKDGLTNQYNRQVAIDPKAPETLRFKRRSRTSTALRFEDFSFTVYEGDGAYLRFDPDVRFCPRFAVPPLND